MFIHKRLLCDSVAQKTFFFILVFPLSSQLEGWEGWCVVRYASVSDLGHRSSRHNNLKNGSESLNFPNIASSITVYHPKDKMSWLLKPAEEGCVEI